MKCDWSNRRGCRNPSRRSTMPRAAKRSGAMREPLIFRALLEITSAKGQLLDRHRIDLGGLHCSWPLLPAKERPASRRCALGWLRRCAWLALLCLPVRSFWNRRLGSAIRVRRRFNVGHTTSCVRASPSDPEADRHRVLSVPWSDWFPNRTCDLTPHRRREDQRSQSEEPRCGQAGPPLDWNR